MSYSTDSIIQSSQRSENSQLGYSKQEIIQAGGIGIVIGFLVGFALKKR
jgi:uncharacterized membrane protein (Fun14 family)